MLQAIFGGEGEISETLTPLAVYGNVASDNDVKQMFNSVPAYEFDLDAARAELAKSKYPNGLSISFAAEPAATKVAQILAPDLAEIGIHLEIEQLTEPAYLEYLYGPRDKLGLTMDYYGSPYADPDALMGYWLSPDQARVNGLNSANYKNPEVGRLLEEQAQETQSARRMEVIGEIFKTMKEEVPYVPLFAPDQFMVISDKYTLRDYSPWTVNFTPWPLLIEQNS